MRFNGGAEVADVNINAVELCSEYIFLNDQQLDICRRYPHATASAVQGMYVKLMCALIQISVEIR